MRKRRKIRKSFIFVVLLFILAIMFYRYVYPLYPSAYKTDIDRYAKQYGIEKALVYSVILAESSFRENVSSHKESRGLMQISIGTGQWAAESLGIENYSDALLYEPSVNIRIGCWYLRKLLDQYGDEAVALAAYNAGSGNVSKWLGDSRYSSDGRTLATIPFQETRNYVARIIRYKPFYQAALRFSAWFDKGEAI